MHAKSPAGAFLTAKHDDRARFFALSLAKIRLFLENQQDVIQDINCLKTCQRKSKHLQALFAVLLTKNSEINTCRNLFLYYIL
jgi:hypothetical protein